MMNDVNSLYHQVIRGYDLSYQESVSLACFMARGDLTPLQTAGVLTTLSNRSVTLIELEGFRDGIFSLAQMIDLSEYDPIDVCGTGGDVKSSFNVSTAVAFVLAGCGIAVAKHGNHGVSSRSGSSSLLEHLGVKFVNDEYALKAQLDAAKICYLHAPLFHPALKNVAQVRKELGIKTIFNLLGPLLNPASVTSQLVGVYNFDVARLFKYFFQRRGGTVSIVHSADGFDEASPYAPSYLYGITSDTEIRAEDFGLITISPSVIATISNVSESAAAFINLLEGRGDRGYRSMVLMNSALALQLRFPKESFESLAERAKESIDSGAARSALKQLIQTSQEHS
jgi:anthranilate phosphoribosyltransferase